MSRSGALRTRPSPTIVTSRVYSSWVKVAVSCLLASMVMDQEPSPLLDKSPASGPVQLPNPQSGLGRGVKVAVSP